MQPTGQSFTDVVNYDKVQYWKDCYGDGSK
jgi:hypothetical protein